MATVCEVALPHNKKEDSTQNIKNRITHKRKCLWVGNLFRGGAYRDIKALLEALDNQKVLIIVSPVHTKPLCESLAALLLTEAPLLKN